MSIFRKITGPITSTRVNELIGTIETPDGELHIIDKNNDHITLTEDQALLLNTAIDRHIDECIAIEKAKWICSADKLERYPHVTIHDMDLSLHTILSLKAAGFTAAEIIALKQDGLI